MPHADEWHTIVIPAPLLGLQYALLYVRLNTSKKQSQSWTVADINSHIDAEYPCSKTQAAFVVADALGKPKLGDWELGLRPKTTNEIRHLFVLVPVAPGKSTHDYEHHADQLQKGNYSTDHVLRQPEVLVWARTMAYHALSSLDPHWRPHLP